MKKLVIVIISVLMLVSCTPESAIEFSPSGYISLSPMPLSGISLEYSPLSACAYKNVAFTLADGQINRIDITTGEQATVMEHKTALGIGANDSCIAVISADSVGLYDYDGNQLVIILHGLSLGEVTDVDILGSRVAFISHTEKRDDIYIADLSNGSILTVSDGWRSSKNRLEVIRLSLLSDRLQLVFRHNFSLAGYDLSLTECDHSGEKVMLAENIQADDGYFDEAGEYYYTEGYSYIMGDTSKLNQVIKKLDRETLTSSNVMLVDNNGLYEMGIKPKESYTSELDQPGYGKVYHTTYSDDYYLEYADGDSFVIYNEDAATFAAFTRDLTLEPLVIIMPTGIHEGILRNWISDYTAQTGRQLEYKIYPEYSQLMLTKLLAQDDDFDIFFSTQDILNGILANEAYAPLDSYPNIVNNLENNYTEGTVGLMTDNGKLFGVPMRISMWGNLWLVDESVSVSVTPTIDEIFALCESLEGSGKTLFKSQTMLDRITQNLLEQMVDSKDDVDVQALTEYFAKLKDYNDRGILCGEENYIFDYGHIYYDYLNLRHLKTDGGRITVAPTQGETRFVEIDLAMLINPASENKDAAAEFIEVVTAEKSVYNNENRLMLGRRLSKNSHIANYDDSITEQVELFASFISGSKHTRLMPAVAAEDYSLSEKIIIPMLSGEITPEKAANDLDYRVAYVMYE